MKKPLCSAKQCRTSVTKLKERRWDPLSPLIFCPLAGSLNWSASAHWGHTWKWDVSQVNCHEAETFSFLASSTHERTFNKSWSELVRLHSPWEAWTNLFFWGNTSSRAQRMRHRVCKPGFFFDFEVKLSALLVSSVQCGRWYWFVSWSVFASLERACITWSSQIFSLSFSQGKTEQSALRQSGRLRPRDDVERETDAEAKELRQALHAVLPETGRENENDENVQGRGARGASSERPEAEGSVEAEARSDHFVLKLSLAVGLGPKRTAVELVCGLWLVGVGFEMP